MKQIQAEHFIKFVCRRGEREGPRERATKSRQKPLNGNKIGEMGKKGNAIGGDAQTPRNTKTPEPLPFPFPACITADHFHPVKAPPFERN